MYDSTAPDSSQNTEMPSSRVVPDVSEQQEKREVSEQQEDRVVPGASELQEKRVAPVVSKQQEKPVKTEQEKPSRVIIYIQKHLPKKVADALLSFLRNPHSKTILLVVAAVCFVILILGLGLGLGLQPSPRYVGDETWCSNYWNVTPICTFDGICKKRSIETMDRQHLPLGTIMKPMKATRNSGTRWRKTVITRWTGTGGLTLFNSSGASGYWVELNSETTSFINYILEGRMATSSLFQGLLWSWAKADYAGTLARANGLTCSAYVGSLIQQWMPVNLTAQAKVVPTYDLYARLCWEYALMDLADLVENTDLNWQFENQAGFVKQWSAKTPPPWANLIGSACNNSASVDPVNVSPSSSLCSLSLFHPLPGPFVHLGAPYLKPGYHIYDTAAIYQSYYTPFPSTISITQTLTINNWQELLLFPLLHTVASAWNSGFFPGPGPSWAAALSGISDVFILSCWPEWMLTSLAVVIKI